MAGEVLMKQRYLVFGLSLVVSGSVLLFSQDKLPLESGLMLRKQVEVAAEPRAVFEVFSSKKGIQTFFAQDGLVELAINGAYELYFDLEAKAGLRGNEGGRILCFVPGELLCFTWNNPPSIPSIRDHFSWVVIRFAPLAEKRTRVELIHLGFGAGPEWSRSLKYFDRAWTVVLSRLAHSFSAGSIDWSNPYTPE